MMPALANAACRRPENVAKFADITRDLSEPYLVCVSCVDRPDCLAWALKHEAHGFWAGFSGKGLDAERKRLGIAFEELRAGEHLPMQKQQRASDSRSAAAARAWARTNGRDVPYRGLVPADVMNDWHAATGGLS